jgi:glycosyltransferase involved in cell wall biosynthesis
MVPASAAEIVDASGRRQLVILADSLVVGGAERVLQALAEDLPGEGFSVRVGCFRSAGTVGEELRKAGVPVDEQIARGARSPSSTARVASYLRRSGAEVVYLLDHSNVLWHGRLAAAWWGLPQVCAIHRTRRADGTPSLGFADRLLSRLSRSVIAVSEGHAAYLREFEGVSPGQLEVVYNGVDVRRFPTNDPGARSRHGLPADVFLWGIVAALRPEKNHEMALRVLARDPESHLALVGDGGRERPLRELASRLGVEARVHWLGRVDDVPALLPALDLVVLPSHPAVETFPVSLLEAMAAARPVLATRVGSLDEMVVDGQTGFLVDAGDEDSFLDALRHLREDAALRSMMGERGRDRVAAHFTRVQMVGQTARILERQVG